MLYRSLPKDRRLWHPKQELFHSATELEWDRQGVCRQTDTSPAVLFCWELLLLLRRHELLARSKRGAELICAFLQTNAWRPNASTWVPQWHWCGTHSSIPSRSPMTTLTASSSNRMPQDATGKAYNQSPLCCDDAARNEAGWKGEVKLLFTIADDQLECQDGPNTAV